MSDSQFHRFNTGRMSYAEKEEFLAELIGSNDEDEEPFGSDDSEDQTYEPECNLNTVRRIIIQCECFVLSLFFIDLFSSQSIICCRNPFS